MILEVPDEYRDAFIGFLQLGIIWLDTQEAEAEEAGCYISVYAEDELAVLEIVTGFIEREEE